MPDDAGTNDQILNHQLGGGKVVEAGAEFVGPTHDRALALIKELGLSLFEPYDGGENVSYIQGIKQTYSDKGLTGTAPPNLMLFPDLLVLALRLDAMSRQVPVDTPWTASKADEWDGMTLRTWIEQNVLNPHTLKVVSLLTEPLWGCEPDEVSFLYALFYVASAGNEQAPGTFERLISVRGGAQQNRVVGGTQLLPLGVARQLGTRVRLSSPVRRISQSAGGVSVICDRGTFHARRAVVALAPSLCQLVRFDPLLPPLRAELQQRMPIGALMKVEARYERPWWRDKGLNGQALSDVGPVKYGLDNTPPEGTPGLLMGFIGGNELRRMNGMSFAQRRQAVLDNFAFYYGPEAHDAVDYFEAKWSLEQWTRGCPVGIAQTGTLTELGSALREPVGRIHWAGTETANYWNGYMDGAIRAGERAAKEVLAEL
jgi:monoamine oxidase